MAALVTDRLHDSPDVTPLPREARAVICRQMALPSIPKTPFPIFGRRLAVRGKADTGRSRRELTRGRPL